MPADPSAAGLTSAGLTSAGLTAAGLTGADLAAVALTKHFNMKARRMSRRYSRSPPRRDYSPRRSPRREDREKRGPPDITDMVSLKVDNLTYRTRIEHLEPLFSKYGKVGDIYIPRNYRTQESRGFAFVRYYDRRDAEDAMERLDGKELDGREIRVSKAMHGRPDGAAGPPRRRDRSRSRSRSPRRRSKSRSRSRGRDYDRSRSRSPR